MTREDGAEVTICIEAEDLYKSMALLEEMRDFLKEQTAVSEGKAKTIDALMVAIETMTAFWAEHFAEDE